MPAAAPTDDRVFTLGLDELRRRTSMKWQTYEPDVLPLWVAEMDCRPAPGVQRFLLDAITTGDTGYPVGDDYRRAWRSFAAEEWGWSFDMAHSLTMPDVMQGVAELVRLSTDPGATVVLPGPTYPPMWSFPRWISREVSEVALTPAGRLDLPALETAFAAPEVQAVVISNPHNPHGTQHTAEELSTLAALAEAAGVVVVSDEIHAPLAPDVVPYLSVPGVRRGFTVTSASKAWNLPGLKAAVAVAAPESADVLSRVPREVWNAHSHLGAASHAVALTEDREWLGRVNAELASHRELLDRLLSEQLPALRRFPSEATYLAWIDASALGWTSPATTFRERGRVALNDGAAFSPPPAVSDASQWVRLNLATSPEILTEAVARMASAVD